MPEEKQPPDPQTQEREKEEQRKKEKALLTQKYREKGIQQLSLAEYEALRSSRKRKKRLNIPTPVKFIFATPVLFVFCYGVFFIPYTMYQVATGRPSKAKQKAVSTQAPRSDSNINQPDSRL